MVESAVQDRRLVRVTKRPTKSARILVINDPSPEHVAELLGNRDAAGIVLKADRFIHSGSSNQAIFDRLQNFPQEIDAIRTSSDPAELVKLFHGVVDLLNKHSAQDPENPTPIESYQYIPLRNAVEDLIGFMAAASESSPLTLKVTLKTVPETEIGTSGKIEKGPVRAITRPFARLTTGAGFDVFSPKDVQIHLRSSTDLGVPTDKPTKVDAFDIIVGNEPRLGQSLRATATMLPGPLLRERVDAIGTKVLTVSVYAERGSRFCCGDMAPFKFKTH